MNYKISKKAATELRELLVRKDTANILYQWYIDQERDGFEVQPHLMVKRIEAKIEVIEIEVRLLEEFGIAMFEEDFLADSLAEYREILASLESNMARRWRNMNDIEKISLLVLIQSVVKVEARPLKNGYQVVAITEQRRRAHRQERRRPQIPCPFLHGPGQRQRT